MTLVAALAVLALALVVCRRGRRHEAAARRLAGEAQAWFDIAITLNDQALRLLAAAESKARDTDALLQEWTS